MNFMFICKMHMMIREVKMANEQYNKCLKLLNKINTLRKDIKTEALDDTYDELECIYKFYFEKLTPKPPFPSPPPHPPIVLINNLHIVTEAPRIPYDES